MARILGTGALLVMQPLLAILTAAAGTATARNANADCCAFACPSLAAAPGSLSPPWVYLSNTKVRSIWPSCPAGGWVRSMGPTGLQRMAQEPRPSVRASPSVVEGSSSACPPGVLDEVDDGALPKRKGRRRVYNCAASSIRKSKGATRDWGWLDSEKETSRWPQKLESWTGRAGVAVVHGEGGKRDLLWQGAHGDGVGKSGVNERTSAAAQSEAPLLWSKPVTSSHDGGVDRSRFRVVLAGQTDLEEAGALCIKVFFGEADSPWKAAQLRQLTGEQRQDLESRCNREESVMFKAVDRWRNEKMVGFIEVSAVPGSKHGMGIGVPLAEARPVVSNLAVDPEARRCGIGTALMSACEDMIKTWNFEDIILQVEEDNEPALAFYRGLGFDSLFVDRAARRYDTSGFLLQNVRTSKLTMRKALSPDTVNRPIPPYTLGDQLAHLLAFVMKPFVTRPPPPSGSHRHGATDSMENLFGVPGVGRSSSASTVASKAQPQQQRAHDSPAIRLHRTRR